MLNLLVNPFDRTAYARFYCYTQITKELENQTYFMKNKNVIISLILLVIFMSPFSIANTQTKVHISAVEFVDFIERPKLDITQKTATDLIWTELKKQHFCLTEDAMLSVADIVTIYLRDRGFQFATAYLPEQNLSSGTLKIAILEGKLGDIQFPGEQRGYVRASIKSVFSDLLGQPVYEPEFSRRLHQLRADPRLNVFGYFSRGSKTGEARVNFKIKKFDRWQFSTYVDNFGNPATGKNRLNLKASLFSPLNRLDTLMVGALHSQGSDSTEASTYGYIAYELPLWDLSNRLSLFIGNNLFEIGGDFRTLELEGDSKVGVIEYSHEWGGRLLQQSVSIAAQAIKTDYKSIYNSPSLEPNEDEIGGRIRWKLSKLSASGLSQVTNLLGYIGGQYNSNQFDGDRQFGKLELAFSAHTLFAVNSRFANQWRFTVSGQYSEKVLPNAEQRSLSGINGVRAIEAGYFSGDRLVHSAIEWRFPGLFGDWKNWQFQPLIFIEGAYGEKLLDSNVSDRTHATGAGLGLELSGYDKFFARIYTMDLIDSYSLSNTAANKMHVLAELGVSF